MSDEDGDNGEERVTMPFKFVTGTFTSRALLRLEKLILNSWYVN